LVALLQDILLTKGKGNNGLKTMTKEPPESKPCPAVNELQICPLQNLP
jgi:hypothetical protein